MYPTKSLIILLFLFSFTILKSQTYDWVEISDRIPAGSGSGTLTDMCFFGDTGWVVNYNPSVTQGELFYTTDAGESFSRITLPYIPNRIFMQNPKRGFVGCNNGHILFTNTGWQSWSYTSGSLGVMIEGMSIPPGSDTGYCCGGASWIGKFDSTGFIDSYMLYKVNLHDICFPADTGQGWTCGNNSVVSRYLNGSWQTLTVPYSSTYHGLFFLPGSSTGWVVGGQDWALNPVISHTTDGINWVIQPHPLTGGKLLEIHMADEMHGWTVGYQILHTADGGNSWQEEAQNYENIWRSVFAVNENLAFAAGNDKRILKYCLIEGTEEISTINGLAVFPNPATDKIMISTGSTDSKAVEINIYSHSGRKVFSKKIIPEAGIYTVPLQGLPEGVYFLNLYNASARFIIIRN